MSQDAETDLKIEEQDQRVQQMMRSFVAEQFTASIIEEPEAQVMFAQWLENRNRRSSRETQRKEWRKLLKVASETPSLKMLEREVERRLIDGRNVVPNKSVNVDISRMIDERFLRKMQEAMESSPEVTEDQRHAFVVFSATLMTGLRVSEWPEAKLEVPEQVPAAADEAVHPKLHVQGAKGKKDEDRPRTLILEGFNATHQHLIGSAIEIAKRLTPAQIGKLSMSLRTLGEYGIADVSQKDILADLSLKSGRKMFTVEALRDRRSKQQVAGALGHTTTVNLRWYANGDIYRDRAMRYPLAKVAQEDAQKVRDTLKEYEERKRQSQEESQGPDSKPGAPQ